MSKAFPSLLLLPHVFSNSSCHSCSETTFKAFNKAKLIKRIGWSLFYNSFYDLQRKAGKITSDFFLILVLENIKYISRNSDVAKNEKVKALREDSEHNQSLILLLTHWVHGVGEKKK